METKTNTPGGYNLVALLESQQSVPSLSENGKN